MKTVIKLFTCFCALFLLTSCYVESDEYVVIDEGNDNYLLIYDNEPINEDEPYTIDGNRIVFTNYHHPIKKDKTYSYLNIDIIAFWDFISDKKNLNSYDKPILVGYKYQDFFDRNNSRRSSLLPGLDVVFVIDGDNNEWIIPSFVHIFEKQNEYFQFINIEGISEHERGPISVFEMNQDFNVFHPAFGSLIYSKNKWSKEDIISTLELNHFEYMIIN